MRKRGAHSGFRPSRSCPHRWCRFLHRSTYMLGLILVLASLVQNPLLLALMVFFSFLLAMAVTTSRMGIGTQGRVAHESAGAGGSADTEVSVDHRWAAIAVGYDIYLAFLVVSGLISLGMMGSSAFKPDHQGIPPGIGWVLIFTSGSFVFGQYAHWRATRPRPRRRVHVKALIPVLSKNT